MVAGISTLFEQTFGPSLPVMLTGGPVKSSYFELPTRGLLCGYWGSVFKVTDLLLDPTRLPNYLTDPSRLLPLDLLAMVSSTEARTNPAWKSSLPPAAIHTESSWLCFRPTGPSAGSRFTWPSTSLACNRINLVAPSSRSRPTSAQQVD